MEITGYLVFKFYDRDKSKIDSLDKIKDYIFIAPEDHANKKAFWEKENNRPKLDKLPIYLNKSMAEGDAEWWPAHTSDDYGVVRKVTIKIEDEVYNTNLREQQTLKDLIKTQKNNSFYKKELKEWEWYNETI